MIGLILLLLVIIIIYYYGFYLFQVNYENGFDGFELAIYKIYNKITMSN